MIYTCGVGILQSIEMIFRLTKFSMCNQTHDKVYIVFLNPFLAETDSLSLIRHAGFENVKLAFLGASASEKLLQK